MLPSESDTLNTRLLNEDSSLSTESHALLHFFKGAINVIGRYTVFVLVILPIALVVGTFAFIPLGNPSDGSTFVNDFTFAILKHPLVWAFFAYFHLSIYGHCFSVKIQHYRPIYVIVFALEAIFNFIVLYNDQSDEIPNLFGLYDFAWFYCVFLTSLYFFHKKYYNASVSRSNAESAVAPPSSTAIYVMLYISFVVALYFCIVTGYVILFREASESLQNNLVLVLALVTFLFKKWLLAICDNIYDVEFSMITAGFWLENLEDVFESLTFPVVVDPETFLVMYFTTFVTNIAYLLFLTKPWFTFRLWIKSHCIWLFTGRENAESEPIEEDFKDDRGHSNIRPGYLRRQVRFFYWKLFSQLVAGVFYCCISTALRYGVNSAYFPFSKDGGYIHRGGISDTAFAYSLAYAGGSAGLALVSFVVANIFLRWKYTIVYASIWEGSIQTVLLVNARYYSYMFAILATNLLLSVMIIQYHSRIFYAWR